MHALMGERRREEAASDTVQHGLLRTRSGVRHISRSTDESAAAYPHALIGTRAGGRRAVYPPVKSSSSAADQVRQRLYSLLDEPTAAAAAAAAASPPQRRVGPHCDDTKTRVGPHCDTTTRVGPHRRTDSAAASPADALEDLQCSERWERSGSEEATLTRTAAAAAERDPHEPIDPHTALTQAVVGAGAVERRRRRDAEAVRRSKNRES
jgi:hypothetical protein